MQHDAADAAAAPGGEPVSTDGNEQPDDSEAAGSDSAGTDPTHHPLVKSILDTMGGQVTRVILKRDTNR